MRPVAATGSWLSSGANRLRTDALSIVEWVISSARPVFDELATALEQTAVALERHDRDLAFNAVQQARAMDVRRGPAERGFCRPQLRVLARAAVTLTRSGPPAPPELVQSLQVMREAVQGLGDALQDVSYRRSTRPEHSVVQDNALAAVRLGGAALRGDPALSLVMIVGQLRSMAVDC